MMYLLQQAVQGVSEPTFIFLGIIAFLATAYYFTNRFDAASSLVITSTNIVIWATWSFMALDVRATQSFCCQPDTYRYTNLAFLGFAAAILFAIFLLRDIVDVIEQRS